MNDFHTQDTIIFDELIKSGFDWGSDDWVIPVIMDRELATLTRKRINRRIVQSYGHREIGSFYPWEFRRFIVRTLTDEMASRARAYIVYSLDLKSGKDSSEKARTVKSDYPQAQLKGTNDYANEGIDYETVYTEENSNMDIAEAELARFEKLGDLDTQIVQAVDKCFSHAAKLGYGIDTPFSGCGYE